MLTSLKNPDVKPMDFCICGTLLTSICQVFGITEFGRVALFLFELQDESLAGHVHPSAIGNVILNVLCDISSSLNISELNNKVSMIKEDRISENHWIPGIENGDSAVDKSINLDFRYIFLNLLISHDQFKDKTPLNLDKRIIMNFVRSDSRLSSFLHQDTEVSHCNFLYVIF